MRKIKQIRSFIDYFPFISVFLITSFIVLVVFIRFYETFETKRSNLFLMCNEICDYQDKDYELLKRKECFCIKREQHD